FCQWLQLYELSQETFTTLLRSYLTVFPQGQLFLASHGTDLLLVAVPAGRGMDLARLSSPAARRQLDRAPIPDPATMGAFWAGPFDSLGTLSAATPLNRDDRPVVEYRAARDLVTVGSSARLVEPGVLAALPFAVARPEGPLFADWTPARWYGARARWLVE